ncbi:hypothetical protein [Ferviditalea candida]|uniref:Uncharacterized protein n=1 Tax=Ferviditalea candida TaxID=3108399 RepID=A0ABU5ZIH2_9BACL|nr:hypothetical protein [Paenibacillaceae bacterium T2]
MKISQTSGISTKLSSIFQILDSISVTTHPEVYQTIKSEIRQLADNLRHMDLDSETSVKNNRDRLAEFRLSVHQILQTAEDLQTQTAELYRKQTGDQKEKFEEMSPAQQEQTNPFAYQTRLAFKELGKLTDILGRLNGELLDLSAQLEQTALQNKSIPDAGPTHLMDHDPAPPTLSP